MTIGMTFRFFPNRMHWQISVQCFLDNWPHLLTQRQYKRVQKFRKKERNQIFAYCEANFQGEIMIAYFWYICFLKVKWIYEEYFLTMGLSIS